MTKTSRSHERDCSEVFDVLTPLIFDAFMPNMRTTVTIEADVEERLREFMNRNRYTFKQALNETLRRGLGSEKAKPSRTFRVEARHMGVKPGVDLTRLNELADEMEVEAFLAKEKQLTQKLAKKSRSK